MAGSLQAEVVAGVHMEPQQKVMQVLEEVLMVEMVMAVLHLRHKQILEAALVEVLVVVAGLLLEVQVLF